MKSTFVNEQQQQRQRQQQPQHVAFSQNGCGCSLGAFLGMAAGHREEIAILGSSNLRIKNLIRSLAMSDVYTYVYYM